MTPVTATNHIIENFWLEYKKNQALFESLASLQSKLNNPDNTDDETESTHESQLHNYREGIAIFQNKILRTTIDLDEIASAAAHLQRKYNKILTTKDYFSTAKENGIEKTSPTPTTSRIKK
tara:strand:- start:21 stop:383 length:363 start_codon:yes stop_codon:yes gene_type:complete